jgi:uncharacterized protein YllA (UPF0747 family)
MKNFSFTVLDFINLSSDELKKTYLSSTPDFENLKWDESDAQLTSVFSNFQNLYQSSAPEITGFLESEWKNIDKSLEKIKSKLKKQVASKHEVNIKHIEHIKSKLFPNSIPQERLYHFFTFCPDGSLKLMHELIEEIDPFCSAVLVVTN